MNLLTPDEEVEYLNLVEGLLTRIKLNRSVPSKWNFMSQLRYENDLNEMQQKMFNRLKRLEEKFKKAC